MTKEIQKKYAKLLVVTGMNVQKGQSVVISADVNQEEFVSYVVEECYNAGASEVDIRWDSQVISKINYKKQSLKTLCETPNWIKERYQKEVDDCSPYLWIISQDPDGLNGVNKSKLQKASVARRKVRKTYMDQIEGKQQWCIGSVPSPEWAKKVFPNLPTDEAVEKLWWAILDTVKVTEKNDPILAWKKHNAAIAGRCKKLNDMKLKKLTYKSKNGTNFTVELIPQALWCGGAGKTTSGIKFNANMPSEEVFTTPMKGKAEGKVVSTKPLSYRGQLIENFSITFKKGKAVEVYAEKGQKILEDMIQSDENAGYLGEVALVPKESPINTSGVLFYETLFDENASCHLALGAGYCDTIKDFDKMSLEDCYALGVNDSVIHVDFMVGADDLSITGISEDGTKHQIFKDGTWAI